jgi:hypothetical protein
MGKARVAIAVTLIVVGCKSTPEGDLKKLGQAVRRGDSAAAVRYLDVDRTTTSLVNEVVMLTLENSKRAEKSDRTSRLGNEMGEAMVRMMQPAIEGMIKQGVYDVLSGRPIRAPAFTKGKADTVSRDSILQLQPRILGSRKFPDSAFVSVEIRRRARTTTETLEVKMEHPEKVWRVVRVDGLESLLDTTAAPGTTLK